MPVGLWRAPAPPGRGAPAHAPGPGHGRCCRSHRRRQAPAPSVSRQPAQAARAGPRHQHHQGSAHSRPHSNYLRGALYVTAADVGAARQAYQAASKRWRSTNKSARAHHATSDDGCVFLQPPSQVDGHTCFATVQRRCVFERWSVYSCARTPSIGAALNLPPQQARRPVLAVVFTGKRRQSGGCCGHHLRALHWHSWRSPSGPWSQHQGCGLRHLPCSGQHSPCTGQLRWRARSGFPHTATVRSGAPARRAPPWVPVRLSEAPYPSGSPSGFAPSRLDERT